MIQPRYRSDYPGEFVVLETRWSKGKKEQRREWVPNPIENQHISGRAACIGSNIDFEHFNYTRLQRHRGGLLGSKKLQTYGNADIALEMKLDFVVSNDNKKLEMLIDNQYAENNIVYTSSRKCIEHPGVFYLTPYNPRLCDLALQIYLAAFDGHQEIFLLGYNNDSMQKNLRQIDDIAQVFNAYNQVKFFLIGEATNMPSQWLDCNNIETMCYRDFVGYCDV